MAEEIELTLCSDALPKAFLRHSTMNTNLPRKVWVFFVANTDGEPSDTFSEIWIYQSRESYEKNETPTTLADISQGLFANGVRSGNLLLFKTRNEAA